MKDACERYLELLSRSLDGEISVEEQDELRSHLAGCADCSRLLEEFRRDEEALRATQTRGDIESEWERAALGRTLQAIRDEPDPAWAATPRQKRWSWRPTLRWSAGLAAAAAAVLLAIRFGPSPTEPIRTRSIPTVREAPAPAVEQQARPEAQAGTELQARTEPGATSAPQATAAPQARTEPEPSSAPEATTAPQAATATQQNAKSGAVMERPAAPAPAVETDAAKMRATDAEESQGVASSNLSQDESPPSESKDELGTRDLRAMRSSPARPERFVAREAAPAPGARSAGGAASPPSSMKVRSVKSGGAGTESAEVLAVDRLNPSIPWYMRVPPEDTTSADRAWAARLSAAETEIAASGDTLASDERARRYRALGDLWEWLGRSAQDPSACVHAVACYRNAVASDPRAAALDSMRVQRARAAITSAGIQRIQPAYR